jgi:hypothetical protein
MGTMSAISRSVKAPRKALNKRSPTKQPEPPGAEYRVGPGRPPRESRFKPGQSGNPKGAKKKPRSLSLDVKGLLEGALNAKTRVKEGEKERITTRLNIGFEQLAIQFAKGDRHARREVIQLAERFGIDLTKNLSFGSDPSDQADVCSHDEAILKDYVRRQIAEREQRDSVTALPRLDGEESYHSQIDGDLT